VSCAIDVRADPVTPLLLITGTVGLILGIVHVCPSVLTGLG
jgi:hypothetical protein